MNHVTRLCPHCFVGAMKLAHKIAPLTLFHDPLGMAGVQVSVHSGRVVTTQGGIAVSSSREVVQA